MSTNFKLLLVDDEVDLLESIAEDLELEGFHVTQAQNGKMALDLITKEQDLDQFDAVVSDIAMPIMDGLTMLAEMRKAGKSTPLIFLSGYADKEKAIEAMKNGAIDMLDKPYDRNHFIQAVTRAAQFGLEMRKMELDFVNNLQKSGIAKDQQEKMILAYKEIIRMRAIAKVYNK